jgi:hypothetical protein
MSMSVPEPIRPEVQVVHKPALFTSWPPEIYERAKAFWSTYDGRNASATERMLQAEVDAGAPVPAAVTIRRWATTDHWHLEADHELETTRGQTVRQLQVGWLTALELAQGTLIAGSLGLLDDLPYGGSARLKSAELTLRTLERAGPLVSLPDPLPPDPDAQSKLSEKEKSRQNRERIAEGKRRDAEKRGR